MPASVSARRRPRAATALGFGGRRRARAALASARATGEAAHWAMPGEPESAAHASNGGVGTAHEGAQPHPAEPAAAHVNLPHDAVARASSLISLEPATKRELGMTLLRATRVRASIVT